MNWVDLVQDRDRCRVLVNAVMNLRVYRVSVGKPLGKNHLEDRGVGGRIILRWIFRKLEVCIEWIDLAQYRDR